jgi:hypothetical protein
MHRPLKMRLRRVAPERLAQRRAEMHALLHPNGVEANESGLEARLQTVVWGEAKLLALVRLLLLGSLALAAERPDYCERPELWRERLMDVLAGMQQGAGQQQGAMGELRRRRGREPGLNERLRNLAQHMVGLVALLQEFRWRHPVLSRLRWPVIDAVAQLMCVDADASFAVSRDVKELNEGPAATMLREVRRRGRGVSWCVDLQAHLSVH